jgi:hypothetical protein
VNKKLNPLKRYSYEEVFYLYSNDHPDDDSVYQLRY